MITKKMLLSPFLPMGEMGKEKRISKRRDLSGWAEGVTFREMGQQVGSCFNAVKKLARGGTTSHEVFMICQM
jgi:hypothetical protein